MFEQHPIIAGNFFYLRWFELKYPGHYENYLGPVPFVVNLLGCLCIASTISLLLPTYVTPLVFIVCLVLPVKKAFDWIFTKMDDHFDQETEVWNGRVNPALCYLMRMVKKERKDILPK
ncbi:hypothetical protein KY290_033055 [Solanum tuberosum]|uniref:Uncharacterized protein n=1 Tax=Solanum tuberosum TaxID=4113 RepID=A0ABQ7U134_SOLTU|nr:hypothetical protein KY285_032305 [Solanum tuberosum]KAH0740012.1 hypothetical protein KY290_033055 [Solanum tuberosum]